MKVGIYVRVSTKEQKTLNQELRLKEYCERNDLEVYKVYRDEGVSGSKTSRPELNKLLEDMRNKLFDCVVVWKFDRLGRSTRHLLQLVEEMKNRGVRLIAIEQNVDTNTSMGKFFFTILSGVAELEREMIRDRIKIGLERAEKEGKTLGRPKGSKDKGRRRTSGYVNRWLKK